MESYFSALSGVTGTEVGYTGGSTVNPTYMNLDGHTESIKIRFDPAVITFDELLGHFWKFRDHTGVYKTQYESAIFAISDDQLAKAVASRDAAGKAAGKPIRVRIEPAGTFYRAEEYHQHYYGTRKG